MKLFLLSRYFLISVLFWAFCSQQTTILLAECLQYATGPYNNLGVAPCAEQCSTPTQPGFAAYSNEAYVVKNCYPGAEYFFGICDGYDAGIWAAELTVAEWDTPNSQIVNGTVMATIKDCQVIFTIPTTYTNPIDIIIVVADANNCGGATLEEENGFLTFGCGQNAGQPACNFIPCDQAFSGNPSGETTICYGDSTALQVADVVMPTPDNPEGKSGFLWLISNSDITNALDPLSLTIGELPVINTTPTPDYIFKYLILSNNEPFVGSLYFTPMVFGNAEQNNPNPLKISSYTLDLDCIHVGKSILVNFLPPNDPTCSDCPILNAAFTDCQDGAFSITIDVTSLGKFDSITISDGIIPQTIKTPSNLIFGPYLGVAGINITLSLETGDPECSGSTTVYHVCPPLCNIVANSGFEEGSGGWATEITPPKSPDITLIGANYPQTGNNSAWLGGFGAAGDSSSIIPQISSLSQTITIPLNTNANLQFALRTPTCGSEQDALVLTIDDKEIWSFTGADPNCGADDYMPYKVVLNDYADGQPHTLTFTATENALLYPDPNNPGSYLGQSNFFLDNIFIDACQCFANAGSVEAEISTDGTEIAGFATGFYEGAGYTYVYMLIDTQTDSLVAFSYVGYFADLIPKTYILAGMQYQGEFGMFENYNIKTFTQAQSLADNQSVCADLTSIVITNTAQELVLQKTKSIDNLQIKVKSEQLWLNFDLYNQHPEDLQLSLINVNGKNIMQWQVHALSGFNQQLLPLPTNLAEGIYLLQINSKKSAYGTYKFIVF